MVNQSAAYTAAGASPASSATGTRRSRPYELFPTADRPRGRCGRQRPPVRRICAAAWASRDRHRPTVRDQPRPGRPTSTPSTTRHPAADPATRRPLVRRPVSPRCALRAGQRPRRRVRPRRRPRPRRPHPVGAGARRRRASSPTRSRSPRPQPYYLAGHPRLGEHTDELRRLAHTAARTRRSHPHAPTSYLSPGSHLMTDLRQPTTSTSTPCSPPKSWRCATGSAPSSTTAIRPNISRMVRGRTLPPGTGQGDGPPRPARHAPARATAAPAAPPSSTASPPWNWRPATPASAPSSPCRDRWP